MKYSPKRKVRLTIHHVRRTKTKSKKAILYCPAIAPGKVKVGRARHPSATRKNVKSNGPLAIFESLFVRVAFTNNYAPDSQLIGDAAFWMFLDHNFH
jgi:hypothetical protein